ncbi:MAG: hypothetical protein GY856_19665 [bacterium]|nr:hypothetical protein [bacterium]
MAEHEKGQVRRLALQERGGKPACRDGAYIAEGTGNAPFYIAATISNRPEEKNLTTKEGVRAALALETIAGKGEIARVWNEYLWEAFVRVNDTNARKIVLYLAAHEPEERGRDQILSYLELDMPRQSRPRPATGPR